MERVLRTTYVIMYAFQSKTELVPVFQSTETLVPFRIPAESGRNVPPSCQRWQWAAVVVGCSARRWRHSCTIKLSSGRTVIQWRGVGDGTPWCGRRQWLHSGGGGNSFDVGSGADGDVDSIVNGDGNGGGDDDDISGGGCGDDENDVGDDGDSEGGGHHRQQSTQSGSGRNGGGGNDGDGDGNGNSDSDSDNNQLKAAAKETVTAVMATVTATASAMATAGGDTNTAAT